jgi:hypothetical protein
MKFRSFLLNLTVGFSALLFGLAWVGIYQFFVGGSTENNVETCGVQPVEEIKFDINNPESVLPIDFEEDKLSDPKEDENNPKYFDPEGNYFIIDQTAKTAIEFKNISYIKIENKNFHVDAKDTRFGDLIAPKGSIVLDDDKQIELEKIYIVDGKVLLESKVLDGIKYEFVGEFLIKGNFYTLDENTEVLEGTLTKKSNGEVIATGNVTFGWTLE